MSQVERRTLHVDDEVTVTLPVGDDIHPHDSASQVESATSSTTSTRLKLKAKSAALQAEAAALKERHEIELQEENLRRRKEQLDIETRLAVTTAEARIYDEADQVGRSITSYHNDVLEPQSNLNPRSPEWNLNTVPVTPAIQSTNNSVVKPEELLAAIHMPRAELSYFDGNPLEYWNFIRAFQNSVERVCNDDTSRLTRLLQYCTGKAKRVIQCCTIMDPKQGYERAQALLKERFGNSYVIAEAWINKIINGKSFGPNDREWLRDFADDLVNCETTLSSMNYLHEVNTQRVLAKIIGRLPTYLQNRWLRQVRELRVRQSREPNMHDVVAFVTGAAEEANDPVYGKVGGSNSGVQRASRAQAFSGLTDQEAVRPESSTSGTQPHGMTNTSTCAACQGSHKIFQCEHFRNMRPEERRRLAREKGLCFNCLRVGHRAEACRLARTCSVQGCSKKHSRYLHLVSTAEVRSSRNAETEAPATINVNSGSTFTGAGEGRVVLPLVPVKAWDSEKNICISTYALLDNGSTTTFCTQRLANLLQKEGKPKELVLNTLGQSMSRMATNVISMDISDANEHNAIHLDTVYMTPELPISTRCSASNDDLKEWLHLQDVRICDAPLDQVDLLIGQDNPDALIPCEVRKSANHPKAPFAVKTVLGWTVQGPVCGSRQQTAIVNFVRSDTELHQAVERFWQLDSNENVTDDTKGLSTEDRRAMAIMEGSITQVDGHYEMAIPFKQKPLKLPESKSLAEARLQCLRRKLSRDDELRGKYCAGMEDMITKGYASRVEEEDDKGNDGGTWYLPHHPVTNFRKPGKVRIVFDCAAKVSGISLNDNVLQGPDLTNRLVGVLLRFRQEPVAIMADIEAMFNQVRVRPEDRDVLRYLWWSGDDWSCSPETYRMNVHLFGGTWSPSCCSYALRRTAIDNQQGFSTDAVNTVLRNFYVDDCLKSVEDEEKASNLVRELTVLLKCGGFRLAKWVSNSQNVLASVPETERSTGIRNIDLGLEKGCLPTQGALGLSWNIEDDSFIFRTNPKKAPWTKRGLLSVVCSVYDPMGLLSPFTLKGKKLMQDITRKKVGWDEMLPEEDSAEWNSWLADLVQLESARVPRCFKHHDLSVQCYELHHFADASNAAYGSASYLRIIYANGDVGCKLVAAKSRLAPLKTVTLPRLELMAATLAVRMGQMIQRELDISVSKTLFWSDSTIVLQYICNEHKRFHTFVANRIAVIRDSSSPHQWRHVPSRDNAADDVSRGLTAAELCQRSRWWNGPSFLYQPEAMWPEQQLSGELLDDDPEVRRDIGESKSYVTTVETQPDDVIERMLARRSSWNHLKTDVAWILRFITCRFGTVRTEVKGRLSVEELDSAETAILRYIQRNHFHKDIAVSANNELKLKKDNALRKLDPFLTSQGVLCVGGRLRHSVSISEQAKHPVILPKSHHVVDLIVRHVHESHGHVGKEHVLSLLREKYWIIGGRSAVKRILSRCVVCRRISARRGEQKMADLPSDRVTAEKPPFTFVGVDLFGPFMIKRGRCVVKRYGCIFTCLATRAIHIEVVHSLDTGSFLNALQRFISRRGRPVEIRSDNATNFKSGDSELKAAIQQWNNAQVVKYLQQRQIEWKYNPPSASHMGGVWERQIRAVRKVLGTLLKEQTLDDEGLLTVMCQAEYIVNSRPLTAVSDDINDLEALTPNHLLTMRHEPALPPGIFVKEDNYCKRRWKQIQYISDVFWKRWTKEYLPTLQQRSKWFTVNRDFRPGDIVLLMEESTRGSWPLARITAVHKSNDGHVRSVTLKVRDASQVLRPITKISLLESDIQLDCSS